MVHPSPPGSDGRGAADQVREHKAGHTDTEKDRRARARAGIDAVDTLLEILELRHLRGEEVGVGRLPEWRRGLEASGLVVPVAVSSAATTVSLHDRLLDWQEELLNTAYPRRAMNTRLEHDSHEVVGQVGRLPTGHPAPISTNHRAVSGGLATQTWRRGTHRWYGACRQTTLRSGRSTRGHLDPDPRAAAPIAPAEGRRTRESLDALTDREASVLRVVAEGLTNAQAAGRLHLSEHTVAAHLRSIFRKIGVVSRSAATRYAIENGLT
jgi:DNA-binding CsgD family transcriptional regulator